MKNIPLIILLSIGLNTSWAQDPAPTEPADEKISNSQGTVDTGDKSFIGDPDPLDVLEKKNSENLILDSKEPVFEEITDILDEPKKKKATKKEVAKPAAPPSEPVDESVANSVPATPALEEPVDESAKPKKVSVKKVSKRKKAKKAATSTDISGDDPNLVKEERFHRIYKKFNQNPTDEQVWGTASQSRQSLTYSVQRGDTLSAVSETLFGDPSFWPKIWSLNSDSILNPHEVSVGQAIHFYPGSTMEAPSLSVGVTKEGGVERVRPVKTNIPESQLPANRKKSPKMASLPEHFRNIEMARGQKEAIQKIKLENVNPIRQFAEPRLTLPYSVYDRDPAYAATVLEGEDGRSVFADFTECLVKFNSPPSGKYYYAIEQKNSFEGLIGDGLIFENLAQLELVAPVNVEENIYRMRVTQAIGYMAVGARLVQGMIPTYDLTQVSEGAAIKAPILSGMQVSEAQLSGQHSYVFIKAGRAEGVAPGQQYRIEADPEVRKLKSSITQNTKVIGKLVTLQVSDEYSIGVLTNSTQEVYPGDHIIK